MTVADLGKARDFYVGVLGFKVIWERFLAPGTRSFDVLTGLQGASANIVLVSNGALNLEIFEYLIPRPAVRDRPSPADCGYTHIALAVADIAATYTALAGRGVEFHSEPMLQPSGNTNVYCRDPFGNIVELIEYHNPVDIGVAPGIHDGRALPAGSPAGQGS
jgi:catechol 2,3-dioxygenase-like lactoylglutathione lyase family enzyme